MSDNETSGSDSGNEEYEEVMYQCKHCPGTKFNSRERDEHRLVHQVERERRRAEVPGPSSRGNERRLSPAQSSTATLFDVIPPSSPPKKRLRETTKKPLKPGPPARGPGRKNKNKQPRKIVSNRKYDQSQDIKTRYGSG